MPPSRSCGHLPRSDPDRPYLVRLAGVLTLVGAAPTTLFALMALSLAGELRDFGDLLSPGTLPFLLAPIVQVWGGIRLLRGRGWLLCVLSALPALLPLSLLLQNLLVGDWDALGAPLGWSTCSVVAAGLALTPAVRGWVAAVRAQRDGRTR